MTLVKPPSFRAGPPPEPRVSIAVRREAEALWVSFNGTAGGHAERLSLAEAEALAESLVAHVEVARFEQAWGQAKAEQSA